MLTECTVHWQMKNRTSQKQKKSKCKQKSHPSESDYRFSKIGESNQRTKSTILYLINFFSEKSNWRYFLGELNKK
jgi:hypothetical protein